MAASFRISRQRLTTRLPAHAPATIALVGAAVLWGTAAAAAKTVLKQMPVFVLAELRWLIALAVILPLLRRSGERPASGNGVALLGLSGLALFYLFYSYGLRNTTAASATLISGATPVMVALLAAGMLHERIGRTRSVGIAVSLLGVALIVMTGAGVGGTLNGNLLMVGSAASWAVYTIIGRRVFAPGSALAILAGTALFGMLFMLPPAFAEVARGEVQSIDATAWVLLLYLSLGPSALAYLLWGYGLARTEASQASVFGQLVPLVGVITATLFLGEVITRIQLIGGATILAGVWIASRRRPTAAPTA